MTDCDRIRSQFHRAAFLQKVSLRFKEHKRLAEEVSLLFCHTSYVTSRHSRNEKAVIGDAFGHPLTSNIDGYQFFDDVRQKLNA